MKSSSTILPIRGSFPALAEMTAEGHYLNLGYASVTQYAEVKLQLDPRKTRDLVRIGRALPDLPVLDQAFAKGALSWTRARELLSVIAPETETEWVELARLSTSRELERAVSAHSPGEPPGDERDKDSGPKRLTFSMEPVEAEQVRTALAAIRAATGGSREEVGDGVLLAQMAARVLEDLEGTEAPTGERFRIVIEHCPECKQTSTPDAEVSVNTIHDPEEDGEGEGEDDRCNDQGPAPAAGVAAAHLDVDGPTVDLDHDVAGRALGSRVDAVIRRVDVDLPPSIWTVVVPRFALSAAVRSRVPPTRRDHSRLGGYQTGAQ